MRLVGGGFEARQKAISELLEAPGTDTSAEGVQDRIEELVGNGPYDWREGVILYGDVTDAVPAPRTESSETEGQKVLEFATPHVLLIDKWNGSGHDVQIPAPMKKTLTRVGYEEDAAPQTGRAYLGGRPRGV